MHTLKLEICEHAEICVCGITLKLAFVVLGVQIEVNSSSVDEFRIVAADTSHKNSFREESRILLNKTTSFSIQNK